MRKESKTLLLVEDDSLLAITESHWLKKAGYKVIHVSNGETAVEIVREKRDQIDLILMDINLGSGIDGTQAAQEILRENDIPLLFLSSRLEKEIVDKTEQITSYGYVVKSSNEVVLLASIKMAFRLHDANTELIAQKKALSISEEKFSKAFYTSPDSIAINRFRDGVYFEINEGFTKLTGYTAKEIIGRSSSPSDLNIWVNEDDRNRLVEGLKENGEVTNLEAQFRFKNGMIHIGLMSARIIQIDSEKYILTITKDITDRKLIEKALQAKEEKYRGLIDMAPDSFFQGDEKGNLITVNNKAFDLTGYTKEELLRMNIKDLFPQEIINEKPLRYDLLELGKTIIVEREILRNDGVRVPVEMNSKKMPDGTFQSFMRDITERKLAVKILRESEKKYRDLFEKSDDAILIIENGIFVDCNLATVKMLRYSYKEQLLQTHPSELSPHKQPDGRLSYEKADEMMAIALEKGSHRFEWCHKKADNELFDVEVLLTAVNTSEEIKILHTVWRDITERKYAEKALKEGEERYRTLFDLSPSGIMLLDTKGNIINANSAACKSTEYSKEEFIGKNIRILVHPQYIPEVDTHIAKLLSGETLEHEVINIAKDGTLRTIELRESLISLPNGSKGILSITNDITERKKIEDRLKSSEIFYRQVIENTGSVPFQIIFGDTFGSGHYKFMGTAIEKLTGLKPNEVDEKTFSRMVIKTIPLLNNIPINPIECRNKFINGELEQFSADILIKSKMGEYKWLHDSSLPIWDEFHLRVIGAMGILIDISDRKFAEEILKKSEEKFRNLIEKMPDAVYKSSHEGKFLEVNPAMVKMLGYNSEEDLKAIDIKKDLYFEITDRESAALIEKYEEMAIFRLKKKDGTEIWVEDHGRHILDENGNVLYHEGIMRDVTERKYSEDALQESEERFRTIFESNSSAIAIIAADTTILMVNDSYCQLSGYTKEEVVGMRWTQQISSDDLPRLKEYNYKRLNNYPDVPSKYDFKFYRKNGEIRHGLMSVSLMQTKKEIIASFIDITDRKRAEQELLHRQYLMDSLMNTSTDHIYFKDINSRFIQINKEMVDFLSLKSNEEAIGKTDYNFFSKEHADPAYADEQKIIETGIPIIGVEEKEVWPDGHITWAFTSKFPLRDKEGKIIGTFGVSRDITELKLINLQLSKYADELKTANAAKDKFFSIISHDLKNPFHSINSALKLMLNQEETLSDEEMKHFLSSIHNTSEKAFTLLENLLLWSRSQMNTVEFKPEKTNLYEVVVQNTELFKNNAQLKNITFINRIDESTFVYGDNNMLETVVRNLLSNAIKFTGEFGKIIIESEIINEMLEVRIIDDGIGIEAQNIDRLFKIDQSYSTYGTKNETGTGLGLILCKEFIEMNAGKIWIESEMSKGTKVIFSLPLCL